MTKITIVDAVCGSGKTSWAKQEINNSVSQDIFVEDDREKYIFVTPYLREINKLVKEIKIDFFQPSNTDGKGSKLEDLKMLLKLRKNIATTHEIFKRLDVEALDLIEEMGYTLIMDEAIQVIEPVKDIDESDVEMLLNFNIIKIGELGKVSWNYEKYESKSFSRYGDIKIMADNDTLYVENNKAFYRTIHTRAFEAFEEVYILTYLFDGQIQKYYYDMHDIEYTKKSVIHNGKKFELVEYNPQLENREGLISLINVYEGNLNYNFDSRETEELNSKELRKVKKYQLSSRWFNEVATQKDIAQLNKNLLNYFTNIESTATNKIFWTTLKNVASDLKNKKCKYAFKKPDTDDEAYSKKYNFLPFNARATNAYGDRTAMAYVYNRFMNPHEKTFFTSRNVSVNQELLALSDLIQFLFRGCIRNGEPMNCYIPSERMRKLLKDWSEYKI